jgi:hypothetical protein
MDVDDAKASSDSPVVSKSRRGSFEHLIHDEHSKQLEKRVQEVLSSSLECVDRTVQGVIQSQKRVQESIQQLEKVLADADTRHTALDINDPVQKLLQTRMRVERISKTLRDVTNRIENVILSLLVPVSSCLVDEGNCSSASRTQAIGSFFCR